MIISIRPTNPNRILKLATRLLFILGSAVICGMMALPVSAQVCTEVASNCDHDGDGFIKHNKRCVSRNPGCVVDCDDDFYDPENLCSTGSQTRFSAEFSLSPASPFTFFPSSISFITDELQGREEFSNDARNETMVELMRPPVDSQLLNDWNEIFSHCPDLFDPVNDEFSLSYLPGQVRIHRGVDPISIGFAPITITGVDGGSVEMRFGLQGISLSGIPLGEQDIYVFDTHSLFARRLTAGSKKRCQGQGYPLPGGLGSIVLEILP